MADLIDLFSIIGALEGVAGRGVERLSRPARRALAQELTRINSTFATLARARLRDFARFFEAHDAFHARFVERCATARQRHLIGAVRPQVKRYELPYANAVGRDFSAGLREHRAIIAAFRSGTADEVEQAIRENWSQSAERLSAGVGSATLHALDDDRPNM